MSVRYRVTQIHQVTETYLVDADSREEAWAKVNDGGFREGVDLVRTDHGRREVWEIKRHVEDTALPSVDVGHCSVCGTPESHCRRDALLCCGGCQHT